MEGGCLENTNKTPRPTKKKKKKGLKARKGLKGKGKAKKKRALRSSRLESRDEEAGAKEKDKKGRKPKLVIEE